MEKHYPDPGGIGGNGKNHDTAKEEKRGRFSPTKRKRVGL